MLVLDPGQASTSSWSFLKIWTLERGWRTGNLPSTVSGNVDWCSHYGEQCGRVFCCVFSVAKSCLTVCDPMDCTRQASLFFTVSRNLLKFMSIESVMLSNCHILCHPLLLLPSIFSTSRVFSKQSALCIRWPKNWSFSVIPSNEGLVSFRSDWFSLHAVQGTVKSLPQHHNKLKIELPYDPAIPLMVIYPEKTLLKKDTCTPMLIAALFTLAKTWAHQQRNG